MKLYPSFTTGRNNLNEIPPCIATSYSFPQRFIVSLNHSGNVLSYTQDCFVFARVRFNFERLFEVQAKVQSSG